MDARLPAPSSTPEDKGTIYRAFEGGGAFRNGHQIEVAQEDNPTGKRIVALPGSYWTQFRPTGPLKKNPGRGPSTGSMCYEQALVARGGLHYTLFGVPSIWDVAAGAIIVKEAGGMTLARRRYTNQWRELDTFFSEENRPKDLDAARKWRQSPPHRQPRPRAIHFQTHQESEPAQTRAKEKITLVGKRKVASIPL